MRRRNPIQRPAPGNSSEPPLLKITIAVIGAAALIVVALINRSIAVLPIHLTQTAGAMLRFTEATTHEPTEMPIQTSTTVAGPLQETNTPTDGFPIDVRKLEPGESSIPSIWDENGIKVYDMNFPGKKTYSGFVQMGQDYLFSLFWCATSTGTLNQNMENIRTSFFVNGKVVSENYISTYNQDRDDWKCRYAAVVLGGWTAHEEYTLEAKRSFLTKIFDGKTSYPAGNYIYEVVVEVR